MKNKCSVILFFLFNPILPNGISNSRPNVLTVEVEQGFWGDWCGCEHKHLQSFQALSADLCCHLLVDLAHMIQLQHLQAHAVPRWG